MKYTSTLAGPVLSAAVIFIFSMPRALADEPLELEPMMVVTPSRAEESVDHALASITVLTAEDIAYSVAQDLFDLLRLQPGLDVVRTGGAGGQTSVFMRGANSNHTLVLIDGVRVNSANTGGFAWEQLPLNQVERVEIVRGPRASLFGSDAIGGVIQVFTRSSESPLARATYGSHSTRELEAGTGFRLGTADLSLSAGYRKTDGFSAQNEGGFSFHPDNDGFESHNLGVSGAGQTENGSWQFRMLALENEVEFDQGESRSDQLFLSLSRDGQLREGWDYLVRAGYADEELESDFGFFTTGFESRRFDLSLENRVRFKDSGFTFGVDYFDESGESDFNYDESRHNTAAFALWDRRAADARIQLSGRLDRNSEFGTEFTWQAGVRCPVGKGAEILGLAGSAFRAPTLTEQFSPGFGGLFAGNPDLQPESSRSLEFIYRSGIGEGGRFAASLYWTDVEQLIAFSGAGFQAVNIHEAELRGFETDYALSRGPWKFGVTATLQHTEDLSTGSSLLRRPDRKASVSANRMFAGGSWLAAEWFVSGDRRDIAADLPGYALLNLSGGYRVNPSISIELRLDNLLDRDYEPASGFNSADRSAFVSVSWTP